MTVEKPDDTRTSIDTQGGAFVGGGVEVADGDFVGRDKVAGDKVLGDKIITVTYEAPPPRPLPQAEAQERRNLTILLNKVKTFWIESVLEKSIHQVALIDLGKETQAEAVANAWEQVLELPDQSRQTLPPDKKISHIFDEMNRALLILGKPGSGKTITLLQLAQDLIVQAETDETFTQPVPVVFNLSSWIDTQQPLIDWMVVELSNKYQIPKKIGRPWLENNRILPLLDGLDEVKAENRTACVEGINRFGEEFGLAGLVVCSRQEEYSSLPVRLKLNGAIRLQPLTLEQIYDYLDIAGSKLDVLRTTLQTDEELQEMAHSPLILGIMSLAYQDMPLDALPSRTIETEIRRKQLFDTYIERMFQRKGQGNKPYTNEQAKSWLSWLAHKMDQHDRTEFLIEQMQPDWLPTHLQKWQYFFSITLTLLIPISLLIGLGRGLFLRPTVGWIAGVFIGLAVGLTIWLAIRRTFGLLGGLSVGGAFGLAVGLTLGVNYSPSVGMLSGLTFGTATGLIYGQIGRWVIRGTNVRWDKIEVVEKLSWSWLKATLGLAIGLFIGFVFGLALGQIVWPPIALEFGLAFSLAGGLLACLFSGLTSDKIELKTTPNQGIRQSIRNSIQIGLLVLLAVGLPTVAVSQLIWTALPGRIDSLSANMIVGLSIGCTVGVICGMIASLFFGGLAVIQHYTLRFILWHKGYIPWNYIEFLDYATERVFLQRVGGGYIFINRLLLEHFAKTNKISSSRTG